MSVRKKCVVMDLALIYVREGTGSVHRTRRGIVDDVRRWVSVTWFTLHAPQA